MPELVVIKLTETVSLGRSSYMAHVFILNVCLDTRRALSLYLVPTLHLNMITLSKRF